MIRKASKARLAAQLGLAFFSAAVIAGMAGAQPAIGTKAPYSPVSISVGPTNVSSSFSVADGPLTHSATYGLSQVLTLTNISSDTISGPTELVITDLTAGVTVTNANGTYDGDPYITMTAGAFSPGQKVSIRIQFSDPSGDRFGYNVEEYSGVIRPPAA